MKILKKLIIIIAITMIMIFSVVPQKPTFAARLTSGEAAAIEAGKAVAQTAKSFLEGQDSQGRNYRDLIIYDDQIEETNRYMYTGTKTSSGTDSQGNRYNDKYAADSETFANSILHAATGLGNEQYTALVGQTTDGRLDGKTNVTGSNYETGVKPGSSDMQSMEWTGVNDLREGDFICQADKVSIYIGDNQVIDMTEDGLLKRDIGDVIDLNQLTAGKVKIARISSNANLKEENIKTSWKSYTQNKVDVNGNKLNYDEMTDAGSSIESDAGDDDDGWSKLWRGIEKIFDGIANLFIGFIRVIPVVIGGALQLFAGRVASIGGGKEFTFLTVENVIFNDVDIVNVDFFGQIGDSGDLGEISGNIAKWYLTLRNIAIILSLIVLIYVGIRMAISTVAEDTAKYKKMLMDWLVGFILIFLLHYIIYIVINVSNAFVEGIKGSETIQNSNGGWDSYALSLAGEAINLFNFSLIKGLAAGILYLGLVIMAIIFLLDYIKRMITVAFLIIIAPIITVTYSIDRMGDR